MQIKFKINTIFRVFFRYFLIIQRILSLQACANCYFWEEGHFNIVTAQDLILKEFSFILEVSANTSICHLFK